jgi:signal transduction histidine kinase/CheY-like chemotaxis protein
MSNTQLLDKFAEDEVELEKVRLLFVNTGIAQAVVAINSLVLLFVVGGTSPPGWAVIWTLVAIILAAARYGLARRFLSLPFNIRVTVMWKRRAIASALVAAFLWSGGGAAMMVSEPGATRMLVAIVMAGMVAGAVPLLSSVPSAFRAYAVPVMCTIAATAILDSRGLHDWVLAFVCVLYLFALLRSSMYFHDALDRSIRMAVQMRLMASELKDALGKAESANLSKSRFLATMSHEIRTPMNGILGMAQMLLMDGVGEAARQDYARTILNSGQTLLTLLNDILDFSKIEAGRLEFEKSVFDPEQVLHETANLFQENAAHKGLQLEAHWEGTVQRYLSDPNRIRQMLSNLTNNAIKFTANGKVSLHAKELERLEGMALIEFSVSDNGIGIEKDKQELLFKAFSQADSSITRQFGGTGLGLSIVRSLALNMGGDVGVDSTPEQGSRFWFRIRAEVVQAGADQRHSARANEEMAVSSGPLKGNILVVEDDPTNQKIIQAFLGKLGLGCQMASDGQASVRLVEQDPSIDLVLMDVHMPVMDGYVATRNIRAWETSKQQRRRSIIALTAGAFEEDRQLCLDAGMDDFITKPVSLDKLTLTLQRWLPAIKA